MLNGKIYCGSTKTSNKAQALKFEALHRAKIHEQIELGVSEQITIKDALQLFIDSRKASSEYKAFIGFAAKMLGTKTVKKEVVSVFGFDAKAMFHTIQDKDVQRLILARRNEGNGNQSIIRELGLLNQTIKLVKRLGYQVPKVDITEIRKENRVRTEKKLIRFLTPAEEMRLLQELDPHREYPGSVPMDQRNGELSRMMQDAYDIVVVLLDTGARYNEIASLEWHNVDFDNNLIRLYRSKVDNESFLSMTHRARAILQRRFETDKHQRYIFESKAGGPRRYNPAAFDAACIRAGIPDVTFHVLRKTYASRLVQHGISLFDVSKLLGHSDPTTTSKSYAHLAPNVASDRAVKVLNELAVQ
jgi:integrase